MRSVTTNLMVAVVVLHAVLGCCMHHSHAAETGSAAPTGSTKCANDCDRHNTKECASHGPGHGGQGSCHEEKCVYIRPPRDDSQVAAFAIWLANARSMLAPVLNFDRQAAGSPDAEYPVILMPVRSHLAKHVLLI